MAILLLEAIGLCLAAPILLACLRYKRAAALGLVIVAALQTILGLSHLTQARRIDRQLDQRAWYRLAIDEHGRQSATILPLPGMEGIHVSVVDLPPLPSPARELLRAVPWKVSETDPPEGSSVTWFETAHAKCEDDGLPLFEIGNRPLRHSVRVHVDAPPEAHSWLTQVRLQVRPCWFSLKMYPIVAAYFRVRTTACLMGLGISILCLRRKLRRIAPPGTGAACPPTAA